MTNRLPEQLPDQLTEIHQTERLQIEPLLPLHALEVFPEITDERLYQFIPTLPPTLASLQTRYQKLLARRSPDGQQLWLNWILRDRDSKKVIGTLEATVYNNGSTDVAYMIFSTYQRKGFALEALLWLIEILTLTVKIERFRALIDTRNQASIQLIKRAGFSQIETKYRADYFKGSWSDEFIFELKAKDAGD